MADDESVPFRFETAASAPPAGVQARTVDTGTNVINLADMIAGLESGPRRRPGDA